MAKTIQAKLVKGNANSTYDLQGVVFKGKGDVKAVPARLKEYVASHAHFELVGEEEESNDQEAPEDNTPQSKDDAEETDTEDEDTSASKDDVEEHNDTVLEVLDDMDAEELKAYADDNDINVGNASKASTLRKKIKQALQA